MFATTTAWALKRVVKFIIKRLLGRFIESGLDVEQLDVQLASGTLELRNLRLACGELNAKLGEQPLKIVEGDIGRIGLVVPWTRLGSEPCQVQIEDLELRLAPSATGKRCWQNSQALANMSLRGDDGEDAEGLEEDPEEGGGGSLAEEGMLLVSGYVEKLVKMLQVDVKKIKVLLNVGSGEGTSSTGIQVCANALHSVAVAHHDGNEGGSDEDDCHKVQRRISFSGVTVDLVSRDYFGETEEEEEEGEGEEEEQSDDEFASASLAGTTYLPLLTDESSAGLNGLVHVTISENSETQVCVEMKEVQLLACPERLEQLALVTNGFADSRLTCPLSANTSRNGGSSQSRMRARRQQAGPSAMASTGNDEFFDSESHLWESSASIMELARTSGILGRSKFSRAFAPGGTTTNGDAAAAAESAVGGKQARTCSVEQQGRRNMCIEATIFYVRISLYTNRTQPGMCRESAVDSGTRFMLTGENIGASCKSRRENDNVDILVTSTNIEISVSDSAEARPEEEEFILGQEGTAGGWRRHMPLPAWDWHEQSLRVKKVSRWTILTFYEPPDGRMEFKFSSVTSDRDGARRLQSSLHLLPMLLYWSPSFVRCLDKIKADVNVEMVKLLRAVTAMSGDSDVAPRESASLTVKLPGIRQIVENEDSSRAIVSDIRFCRGDHSFCLGTKSRFGEREELSLVVKMKYAVLYAIDSHSCSQVCCLLSCKEEENSKVKNQDNNAITIEHSWRARPTKSLRRRRIKETLRHDSFERYESFEDYLSKRRADFSLVQREAADASSASITATCRHVDVNLSKGPLESLTGVCDDVTATMLHRASESHQPGGKKTLRREQKAFSLTLAVEHIDCHIDFAGAKKRPCFDALVLHAESLCAFAATMQCAGEGEQSVFLTASVRGYGVTGSRPCSKLWPSVTLVSRQGGGGGTEPSLIAAHLSEYESDPCLNVLEGLNLFTVSAGMSAPVWIEDIVNFGQLFLPPLEEARRDMDTFIHLNGISAAFLSLSEVAETEPIGIAIIHNVSLTHFARGSESMVEFVADNANILIGEAPFDEVCAAISTASGDRASRRLLTQLGFHRLAWDEQIQMSVKSDNETGGFTLACVDNNKIHIKFSPKILSAVSDFVEYAHKADCCFVRRRGDDSSDVVKEEEEEEKSETEPPFGTGSPRAGTTATTPTTTTSVMTAVDQTAFVRSEGKYEPLMNDADNSDIVLVAGSDDAVFRTGVDDGFFEHNSEDEAYGDSECGLQEGFEDAVATWYDPNIDVKEDYVVVSGEDAAESEELLTGSTGDLPSEYPPSTTRLVLRRLSMVCSMQGEDPVAENVEVGFEDFNLQLDVFEEGSQLNWRVGVSVRDVEILDYSATSSWRKVLGYHRRRDKPRETNSVMVAIEVVAVRPDPTQMALEYRLYAALLPLRVRLDQKVVLFFMKLSDNLKCTAAGSSESDSNSSSAPSNSNEEDSGFFIQSCIIRSIMIFIDYNPRRIDIGAIRGGNYAELLNLVPWGGVHLKLKDMHITGIQGAPVFFGLIIGEWLEEISQTQAHKFAKGIVAVRSFYSIASGLSAVFTEPAAEMRREDGKLLRGVHRGLAVMVQKLSAELLKVGCHVADKAAGVLQEAEHRISSRNYNNNNNNAQKSRCLKEPDCVAAGLQQAAASLRAGWQHAAAAINEPSPGTSPGALIVAPASAAVAEAVHKALLGARNGLDPERRIDKEDGQCQGRVPAVEYSDCNTN